MNDVRTGETVKFTPKKNEQFPTGEESRMAVVEDVLENELVVRQLDDGFTRRITDKQIIEGSFEKEES